MKNPVSDTSNIQVIAQLLLSGVLAREQSCSCLNQELGDVFIFLWQVYLAQEFSEGEAQFTSKNFDPDIGLYYYNARWYDPELGRFTTEDPARANSNWYIYASNNPIMRIDPSGLDDIWSFLGFQMPDFGSDFVNQEVNDVAHREVTQVMEQVSEVKGPPIYLEDENPGISFEYRRSLKIPLPDIGPFSASFNAVAGVPFDLAILSGSASDSIDFKMKLEFAIDYQIKDPIPGLEKLANFSVGLRVNVGEINSSQLANMVGEITSGAIADRNFGDWLSDFGVLDIKAAVSVKMLDEKFAINYRKEVYDGSDNPDPGNVDFDDILGNVLTNFLQIVNEGEIGFSREIGSNLTEETRIKY